MLSQVILEAISDMPDPVFIKVHFGRSGLVNSHLDPTIFQGLLKERECCFVDTNTLYGGERSDSQRHHALALKHGFSPCKIISDVCLQGTVVNAAHITGHNIMGLGACIKNIAMGLATATEKAWVHGANVRYDAGKLTTDTIPTGKKEAQAYRLGYMAARIEKRIPSMFHIAIADEITRTCDCMGSTETREVLIKDDWYASGETSLYVDKIVWSRYKDILSAFYKPSVVKAQFDGYNYER